VAKRKQQSRAETVPGVTSVQARAPARRESGREFQALGPEAQTDRSLTVFNLKAGTAEVEKSDDLKARKWVYNSLAAQLL